MNNLNTLIEKIKLQPQAIEFQNVIDTINACYDYTPAQFHNGPDGDCVTSKAGENEGSCKIFAFALLNKLDENQTLNCFGQYYRDDVLNHPDNKDHGNIRNLMEYGLENISFESNALKIKE